MPDATAPPADPAVTRRKPARWWYALSAAMMVGSAAVFGGVVLAKAKQARSHIEPMPRFVGPTGEAGTLVNLKPPGKYALFYENRGTLDGRAFDTPRRQVWTTFDAPSMTCTVVDAETGDTVQVRLPGVGEVVDKRVVTRDLVYAYDLPDRQGHSVWAFDIDRPGEYRITLNYVESLALEPDEVEVPPELTPAQQELMLSGEGAAYEAARRDALERRELAALDPVDVLFAVGQDPTRGGYFELIGLKGAATVFAFGFTFSLLIAGVTYMLRHGHVTPRGEMAAVKRLGFSERDA